MKVKDFEIYKDLLKNRGGLVITPDKSYLLDSRLNPVAKKWGYDSLDSMTVALQAVPDKEMINDIVEAMTTNETSFFRDKRPFDLFENFVLPYMEESRSAQKKLRIWCAACSSGQEPYSLAMILKEKPAFSSWNIDILGTDLSHEILQQAKDAVYSQFEVQRGLPIQLLVKYFTQQEEKWHLNQDIKSMVRYQYFNLLESMSAMGSFDIVFLRNVLIYFDEDTKRLVLENVVKQMPPDGLLFLGGAETVLGITDAFKPVPERRGLYARPDSPHMQNTAGNKSALENRAVSS